MDVNGYITGRYGYVDAYGQPQETGTEKASFLIDIDLI